MGNINNLPKYALECKYVVARIHNGELWFYGAFDSLERAYLATEEINGRCFTVEEWRWGKK